MWLCVFVCVLVLLCVAELVSPTLHGCGSDNAAAVPGSMEVLS